MSKQTFISSIANSDLISSTELEEIIEKYPYFQSARIVLAKKVKKETPKEAKKSVVTAAVYSTNRKVLKKYLDDDVLFDQIKKALKEQKSNTALTKGATQPKSKPVETTKPTSKKLSTKPDDKVVSSKPVSQEQASRQLKREKEKELKKDLDSIKNRIQKAGDQKLTKKVEVTTTPVEQKEPEESPSVPTPEVPTSQEDLYIGSGHDEISGNVLIDDVYKTLSELQQRVSAFDAAQAKASLVVQEEVPKPNTKKQAEPPVEVEADTKPETNKSQEAKAKEKSNSPVASEESIVAENEEKIADLDMDDTLAKLSFAIGEFNKEEEKIEQKLDEQQKLDASGNEPSIAEDIESDGDIDLDKELKISLDEIKKEIEEEVVKEDTEKKQAAEKKKTVSKKATAKKTNSVEEPPKKKITTKATKAATEKKEPVAKSSKPLKKETSAEKPLKPTTEEVKTEKPASDAYLDKKADSKPNVTIKKTAAGGNTKSPTKAKVSLSIGKSGLSSAGKVRKIVKIPPSYSKKEEPSGRQGDIIDKFIKNEPSISKPKTSKATDTDTADLSQKSGSLNDDLVSENLAEIYLEQNKFDKAVDTYEKLILKNPEKKAYFAAKIKEIKEKD